MQKNDFEKSHNIVNAKHLKTLSWTAEINQSIKSQTWRSEQDNKT